MNSKALVLLSGGQDSTTALFWAKERFAPVRAVSFDYGQRHRIELSSAMAIAAIAGVYHEVIDAPFINKLAPSALTRPGSISAESGKIPNTFVPGRNLFFLSMAAVYGAQRGIFNLVTGMSQADYSGYPDCRRDFVDSMETTLLLATGKKVRVHTPMMYLTKAQEVDLAVQLGTGCMEALACSHTCYEGVFPPCGVCPACVLREKGFAEAGVSDPLYKRMKK